MSPTSLGSNTFKDLLAESAYLSFQQLHVSMGLMYETNQCKYKRIIDIGSPEVHAKRDAITGKFT